MNFCLRSRVSKKFLEKASEIRVDYRDKESIPDIYHEFKKTIILFPALNNEPYDWKEILNYIILCEGNLVISCPTQEIVNEAKDKKLRFMYATEARTEWELEGMEKEGAEYAYVGMPLFFNLPDIRDRHNIKLRTIPTVAYNHHYPHGDPACGQWIRPEDVEAYEDLIDVMEFEFCDVPREETLYKVYAIDQQWSTRMDILIDDINSNALNRYIDPSLIDARLTCGQRCYMGGHCHFCKTALKMASDDMIKKLTPIIEKNKKI